MDNTGAPNFDGWLTIAQVAARLNRNEKTVRRMIARKDLTAEKITTGTGKEWRIMPNGALEGAGQVPDIVPGTNGQEPDGAGPQPDVVPDSVPGLSMDTAGRGAGIVPDIQSPQIQAITGDVARLSGEVEAMKAFIAGGAMQAITERLAALPDAEQSAAMMAQAVQEGITAALQADTAKEAQAARLADEQNQKLLDAVARLSGEVEALREDRQEKRGFFGRLFGG